MELRQIIFIFLALTLYVRNFCEKIPQKNYEEMKKSLKVEQYHIDEPSYQKFTANISFKAPDESIQERKVSVEVFRNDKNSKQTGEALAETEFKSLVNKELDRRLKLKDCPNKYYQDAKRITPSYPECFHFNNEEFLFMEHRPYESIDSEKFMNMYNGFTDYSKKFELLLNLMKKYEMLYDCGISHGEINLHNIVYSDEKKEFFFINVIRDAPPSIFPPKKLTIFELPVNSEDKSKAGHKKEHTSEDDIFSLGVLVIILEKYKDVEHKLYNEDISHHVNLYNLNHHLSTILDHKRIHLIREKKRELSLDHMTFFFNQFTELIRRMIVIDKKYRFGIKEVIEALNYEKTLYEYMKEYPQYDVRVINEMIESDKKPNHLDSIIRSSEKEDRLIL